MDFLERLSTIIYDKQVLFIQANGKYYSKYHQIEISKSDAEEWLFEDISREIILYRDNMSFN